MEFFRRLFDSDFMPHGHCYFWKPDVLWTNVIGDGIIVLAYFTIPFTLLYFIYKRKDIKFSFLFAMFGLFIFSCGATHLLDIISVWKPIYRLEGLLKLFTGTVSILTAAMFIKIMPLALKFPSRKMLKDANRELKQKTEKLELANLNLEHFAHVSSHDIKSPVSNIQALVQLMEKKKAVKEEHTTEFELIKLSVNNLHQKVLAMEKIFSLSKTIELPKEEVFYEKALTEVKETLAEQIHTHQAVIQSDFSVASVKFPAIHLNSILQNLISNSIKFRKTETPPVIHIASKREGNKILLTVADNGMGINLALHKDKLFGMFRRFHENTEGSGIGLHMIKSILDSNGAEIEVASEIDKGTIFKIYFKL